MKKCFLQTVFFSSVLLLAEICPALDLADVIKNYKNSIADVGFVLKYDEKGEVPTSIGVYCGACSAFHDNNLGNLLANRQDLLVNGFIVSSDELLIPAMLTEVAGIKDVYVNGSIQISFPKGIYIVVTENSSQKVIL